MLSPVYQNSYLDFSPADFPLHFDPNVYLYIRVHFQWIQVYMYSCKTLWYCCKMHQSYIFLAHGHIRWCLNKRNTQITKYKLSFKKKTLTHEQLWKQQYMGRPPLQTFLDMINVVFVLSGSSKLENPPLLLNILKSNAHPHILFHSQWNRFTCTVVRAFVLLLFLLCFAIVTIGIRAARVWPCDTLIDVYIYKADQQLTKIYKRFKRSAALLDIRIWFEHH